MYSYYTTIEELPIGIGPISVPRTRRLVWTYDTFVLAAGVLSGTLWWL